MLGSVWRGRCKEEELRDRAPGARDERRRLEERVREGALRERLVSLLLDELGRYDLEDARDESDGMSAAARATVADVLALL